MAENFEKLDRAALERLEHEPPVDLIRFLRREIEAYPPGSVTRRRLETTILDLQARLREGKPGSGVRD